MDKDLDLDIGWVYGMEGIEYIQRVEREPLFLWIHCQRDHYSIILNDYCACLHLIP